MEEGKLCRHPGLGTLPGLCSCYLQLTQPCAGQPWGRRELVMPEQHKTNSRGKRQGGGTRFQQCGSPASSYKQCKALEFSLPAERANLTFQGLA